MGWTTVYNATDHKWHKGRRIVDRKACCDRIYTCDLKDKDGNVYATCRVIKSAMVGTVWYGAVEHLNLHTNQRKVWAGICLTKGRSEWDGTEFGYKDMDETMCPYYYDCPPSILDLLTPTESETVKEWRESCRENHAKKRKEAKARNFKLPDGITCTYRGGWTVSSPYYTGARYRYSNKRMAVDQFVNSYGTEDQKTAWVTICAQIDGTTSSTDHSVAA